MNCLDFAKSELNKYYQKVTGSYNHNIVLKTDKSLFEKYYPNSKFNKFDDAFEIEIHEGQGQIIGINDRSVLQGVYSLFDSLGCRFLRPSSEGEYIKSVKPEDFSANYYVVPDNRHRSICIEGAVSLENVLDIIDWAPKVGFNGYFIQFRTGHEFFERYYQRQRNDYIKGRDYDLTESKAFVKMIIQEIKKRDMIFHAVGHGWTNEALNIPSTGWQKYEIDDESNYKNLLAEINGKRDFFENIPLNTQLCYSNPNARKLLVTQVIKYLTENPQIDILHFWLADNYNNFCECTNCSQLKPIDHYVGILNELDEQLTYFNIKTKIAFLLYYELLWTPEVNTIKNPDRFIMMFAPITRTYTRPYLKDGQLPNKKQLSIPEFRLNKNVYSSKVEDNLAFLFKWQEKFKSDSFLFDYHLMWDGFKDYPNMRLSKVIYDDIRSLKTLNLNGYVSCQLQRNFFPTGFPMYCLGKTLVDTSISFKNMQEDYFKTAYGQDYRIVLAMLNEQTKLFSFEYARAEVSMINEELAINFKKLIGMCYNYQKKIDELYQKYQDDSFLSKNYYYLTFYTEYARRIAELSFYKSTGANDLELAKMFEELNKYMLTNEDKIQKVFDGFFFNLIVGDFIKAKW